MLKGVPIVNENVSNRQRQGQSTYAGMGGAVQNATAIADKAANRMATHTTPFTNSDSLVFSLRISDVNNRGVGQILT